MTTINHRDAVSTLRECLKRAEAQKDAQRVKALKRFLGRLK